MSRAELLSLFQRLGIRRSSKAITYICDQVYTRQLLHELPADAQKSSVKESLWAVFEQGSFPARSSSEGASGQ